MAASRWGFRRFATGFFLIGALAVLGCSKKNKPEEATSAGATGAGASATADPLLTQIHALASSCEVDPTAATLKCKDNEQRKLVTEFARKGKARIESLKPITVALLDSDPKVQTVAANMLHLGFRSSFGSDVKVGDVPAADAKALIDAIAPLAKPLASRAIPAAVHAAMLSGQQDALYKMLDARAADRLDVVAYRYLMTHGRLIGFSKVKDLVHSEQLPVALAALASPTAMRNWTPDEQAQICPWARDLLDDGRAAVAGRAASLLSNCPGQYVDALLDKGEALFKAGKLGQAQVPPFRDICGPVRRKSPELVSDAQCVRDRQLLEKVTLAPETDARTKALVLSALVYQWPDAETLQLAEKLTKDSDSELARHAVDTVKRLQHRGLKD